MNFNAWLIGQGYTSLKLTKTLRENVAQYQASFVYNSNKPGLLEIYPAHAESKIYSLEEFLKEGCTSLEMEFLNKSLAASETSEIAMPAFLSPVLNKPAMLDKRKFVYLWLKFVPSDGSYRLNASIKSINNKNYLRQKPSAYPGEEEEEVKVEP